MIVFGSPERRSSIKWRLIVLEFWQSDTLGRREMNDLWRRSWWEAGRAKAWVSEARKELVAAEPWVREKEPLKLRISHTVSHMCTPEMERE